MLTAAVTLAGAVAAVVYACCRIAGEADERHDIAEAARMAQSAEEKSQWAALFAERRLGL